VHDPDRKERVMPRLDLGAVSATFKTILRRLDTWTLSTMNSPTVHVLAVDSRARAGRY